MKRLMLIGGEWIDSDATFGVASPFSQVALADVCVADNRLLEKSIAAAVIAAEKMRALPRFGVAASLRAIADGIAARKTEFAQTIALESAKPMIYARGEVERAMETFSWAAGEAERFAGEVVPVDTQPSGRRKSAWTVRQPRGVIYGITPFNFPLNLVAHKVAPALAAKNAIIIKPSPRTPLTALMLGEVFLESGFPRGALQIVPLPVESLQSVFDDERVAMVSFTGSAAVGWEIKKRVGKKALALELGGNAPVIVDESAEIDTTLSRIVTGAFAYSGQICISIQRCFIHSSIYDSFVEKLVHAANSLKRGDPLNEATRLSVMIDEPAAKRVESWIEKAIANGAALLAGGARDGSMLDATIVGSADPECELVAEEAFGPVLVAQKFDSFPDAVAEANRSKFGLQAGVFSNSYSNINYAAEHLEYGGIIINDAPIFRVDNMPYGGLKESGFGREGVRYAMVEMSEPKLIVLG